MEFKAKKPAKESVETAKLEAEKAELINDLQRTRADFENFRKQVEIQREQAKKVATDSTVMKFLPLIDDMSRAISANPDGWCNNTDLTTTVQGIINTVIFIVGMLAVVMIIIGGINYALSQGDPGKVKKAKDTILYGIIGLVVSLLAFAIVQFVLSAIGNS